MPIRELPARPSLAQLKRQADELHRDHRAGKIAAAERVTASHPRPRAGVFKLADAQLVIAREYGFDDWAALKHHVATAARCAAFREHPELAAALAALDAGDVAGLARLLDAHPELVAARTQLEPPYGYFTGATLLHHIAWNPGRDAPVPPNIAEVARLLLDRGAEVDAVTLSRSAGTPMGLVLTSKAASDANVSGALIDVLREHGARLDLSSSKSVIRDWGERNVLDVALANHAERAAARLIELGAEVDVLAAAGLGRMDLLAALFDGDRLRTLPVRRGRPLAERDAIGLALLFAYVRGKRDAVEFLLALDGNWNVTGVDNGTVLHRAAWDGDLAMVQRLVERGADVSNRDNPFMSTPMSWARHNRQTAVVEWLCKHTAVDLHDAVSFDQLEHVHARLREDPASVNARVDHWQIPRSTPLYWAASTQASDVNGRRVLDEGPRLELVRLLLDHGADPNLVAGDGKTALDVALAAGATRIAALLESRGARRGATV